MFLHRADGLVIAVVAKTRFACLKLFFVLSARFDVVDGAEGITSEVPELFRCPRGGDGFAKSEEVPVELDSLNIRPHLPDPNLVVRELRVLVHVGLCREPFVGLVVVYMPYTICILSKPIDEADHADVCIGVEIEPDLLFKLYGCCVIKRCVGVVVITYALFAE